MSAGRTLAALLVFALPAVGHAQGQTEPPPQVQEWIQELQELQSQIEPVQEKALEDSEVAAEQQRTTDFVRAAIIEDDPEMGQVLTRFEQILTEAQTAQENGDAEKIVALTQEAQQLQPRIEAAHASALNKPAVAERVTAFQQQLRAKMIEIDPDVESLLQRVEQLEGRIAALMG